MFSCCEDESLHVREGSSSQGGHVSIDGRVTELRRHGKQLVFVSLEQDVGFLKTVFDSTVFDHDGSVSTFPLTKDALSVGEDVRGSAQWLTLPNVGLRLCVQRWQRCGNLSRTDDPAARLSAQPNDLPTTRLGRRAGKAACAGWVHCALCPNSRRRYNRGAGLAHHLDSVHSAEREAVMAGSTNETAVEVWHAEMATAADAIGVYLRRGHAGVHASDGQRQIGFVDAEDTSANVKFKDAGLVAARDGDEVGLRELLDGGWDPFCSASLDHNGASALDWTAGSGHVACVDLLWPYSSGVVACRRDGRGPAHWAARNGQSDVLQRVLELRADVNARTTNGSTMLMFASYGGHVDTCQMILRGRGDLMARNSFGCDAAHFAGMGGSVVLCQLLSREGLPLDRRQSSGHTVLHKAAQFGNSPLVSHLLSSYSVAQLEDLRNDGASVVCESLALQHHAHLPSTLAGRAGQSECAKLLKAAGL